MDLSIEEKIGLSTIVVVFSLLLGLATYGLIGSSKNLEYVKARAELTAKENNLTIVGYEGYQRGFMGAKVWYMFERKGKGNVLYHGSFQKRPFTNEIHLYSFKAIDAIKSIH
jgi:hypothetical protein